MSIFEVLKDKYDGHIVHDVVKLCKNNQNTTKTNTVEIRTNTNHCYDNSTAQKNRRRK